MKSIFRYIKFGFIIISGILIFPLGLFELGFILGVMKGKNVSILPEFKKQSEINRITEPLNDGYLDESRETVID